MKITLQEIIDKHKEGLLYEYQNKINSTILEVSDRFSIPIESILKMQEKTKNIVEARFTIMWMCNKLYNIRLTTLSKRFNCHHTTVINACRRFEEWYKFDKTFREKINKILLTDNSKLENIDL